MMVLENFLIDADILWDRAGKELYEKPEARAGRIMRVQVTNRGVVEDLTGYTLNLGWKSTVDETKFGLDAFETVGITKGIFELEYTSGMLTNIGTLKATLQLVPVAGNTVESDNFVITVTKSAIDAEAIQSETSFTALAMALVDVNAWNATISGKVIDWEADMEATKQTYITTMNDVEATYPIELNSVKSQLADVAEQLSATNQPIVDIGNYFSTDNTNAALQELGAHKASKSNPHGVTKAQVGLGSVDNTSDANKPISTATQTALNLKANKVQEAWITPTLLNGVASTFIRYRKNEFGKIEIQGDLQSSATAWVVLFKLPVGYRPTQQVRFTVPTDLYNVTLSGLVNIDGNILVRFNNQVTNYLNIAFDI